MIVPDVGEGRQRVPLARSTGILDLAGTSSTESRQTIWLKALLHEVAPAHVALVKQVCQVRPREVSIVEPIDQKRLQTKVDDVTGVGIPTGLLDQRLVQLQPQMMGS